MIRLLSICALLTPLSFAACTSSTGGNTPGAANANFVDRRVANTGRYIRPDYMNPQPTAVIPPVDVCNSRIYAGLLGQHEGAIYIAGLPGNKRIIKPAYFETDYEQVEGIDEPPPYVEVREYLADQTLYAPSITTVVDRINLTPDDPTRLTIELDLEGYVQQVNCR